MNREKKIQELIGQLDKILTQAVSASEDRIEEIAAELRALGVRIVGIEFQIQAAYNEPLQESVAPPEKKDVGVATSFSVKDAKEEGAMMGLSPDDIVAIEAERQKIHAQDVAGIVPIPQQKLLPSAPPRKPLMNEQEINEALGNIRRLVLLLNVRQRSAFVALVQKDFAEIGFSFPRMDDGSSGQAVWVSSMDRLLQAVEIVQAGEAKCALLRVILLALWIAAQEA